MLETVLAVLVVASTFLVLFKLSHMLTGKILLEHASMRVARARAVGYNEFHCRKIARICVIPVAGRRQTPSPGDGDDDFSEPLMARMYLRTPTAGYANGLLDYEYWDQMNLVPGSGGASSVSMKTDIFELRGEAEVDGFPVYMYDQGL